MASDPDSPGGGGGASLLPPIPLPQKRATPPPCYACHRAIGPTAAEAPCGRPEHATHAGRCYAYTHCAATLDGEVPVCGVCAAASDRVRGSFLACLPGTEADGGGGTPNFALVGWATADPGMATVCEMLAQVPPVAELAAARLVPVTAATATVAPPRGAARALIDSALGRAREVAAAAADAEQRSRGEAMLRLEEAARRWEAEAFVDPRAALASGEAPLGQGVLRPESLVAARVSIADLARYGRLDARTLPLAAPTWGDLRALGLSPQHLRTYRTTVFTPAFLARPPYNATGALLCAEVFPEGLAGLARMGYTAAELRTLGVSAPWVLSGPPSNVRVARIAQFVLDPGTPAERSLPLCDWATHLELTPALLRAAPDYREHAVRETWGAADTDAFLCSPPRVGAPIGTAAAAAVPDPATARMRTARERMAESTATLWP